MTQITLKLKINVLDNGNYYAVGTYRMVKGMFRSDTSVGHTTKEGAIAELVEKVKANRPLPTRVIVKEIPFGQKW